MLYVAIGLVAFLFLVAVLWPRGATGSSGGVPTVSFDQPKSRIPSEPEAKDSQHALKVEIAQRIDKIASEPGGLMRFDKNGDGVLESQEMKAARVEIGLEIAKEKGGLPEAQGIAKPVEHEDESQDIKPIFIDD